MQGATAIVEGSAEQPELWDLQEIPYTEKSVLPMLPKSPIPRRVPSPGAF